MCIYPSHPQVTCVFISDSLSSSLQSEEVSPILFPHLICLSLSLDTGPYSKIVSHFSASSPLPNQPISSRAPLNQGVSLGVFFFCLFHLSLLLSYFHMKGHPSSSFLFKFPGPEQNFSNRLFFEIWPWKIGCSFSYCLFICHGCSQTCLEEKNGII